MTMVDATTPAEIERLEELLQRATPGTWAIDGVDLYSVPAYRSLAMMLDQEGIAFDAALIVALRNAAPSLLATIREQREALAARPVGPYGRDYSHLPLVERLRMWIQPPHKPYPTHPRNPDGEEAAATIAAQSADPERLREVERNAHALLKILVAADDEAAPNGIMDCIDNDGSPYQSAFMAGLIVHARAVAQPFDHKAAIATLKETRP